MNQGLHRVVFNAVRGLRMAVAETATSTGKGHNDGNIAAAGATSTSTWRAGMFAIGWTALAAMAVVGFTVDAQAQIVPNPFGAAGQKPQVLVAPNGVPLVNITTPSAAGVSVNQYNQFDVNAAGAILNNSRTTASTQLGGLVQGNPWLATGPARIIVNQVSSSNPSYLNGYIEVAGQRAEVIIANPSGIQANGAGFINTSRATLTTGTPQYGALGTLDAFLVQGGTVTINGNGLDLSTTDYAAILSRALQVNAAIYASDLKVVTGANQISADHAQVTPVAGTGAAPTFALDVSALGGMYAKKITLIGTEAGLGVRNAGSIGASAGKIDGDSVSLVADNQVNLVSAVGKSQNTATNNASGMSGGVALSVGSQNGLVFQGGLYQAKGNQNGASTTNYNTEVTGAKAVSISSGGDTTMQGAVVTGKQVTVDVGGNLSITSPQDTNVSTASSSSAGANVSLCVWWCVGTPVEGSVSGGSSGANSNYVSVGSSQSGIQAGDGGFNVAVAGNTNLVGGVIASTQVAVDKGANTFDSGSLTMTNVTNTSSSGGSGWSVTVGNNTAPSVGYGSVSGGQTGVSVAGISGIAGQSDVRTGDPSGGVKPGPTAGAILADVSAQVFITSTATAASIQAASSQYGNRENTGLPYEYDVDAENSAVVAEGRYARADLLQQVALADQLPYLQEIAEVTAGYVDAMQDQPYCKSCSTEDFKKMNIAVSPLSGLEAGFSESTMATYDPVTNTATVFQNFFSQAKPLQASVLFHEYVHSLSENKLAVQAATAEQRAMQYEAKPWEAPAIRLEGIFQSRFGQNIVGRFK